MAETVRTPTRMDAVQAPIIAGHRRPDPAGAGHDFARPGRRALRAAAEPRSTPSARALDATRRRTSTRTAPGLPALRRAHRARSCARENGIDVARGSRIMVTAGANMAFMHAVLAITAPGDEVILPVPFYFNHEMAIQMAGCTRGPRADRRALSAAARRASRARSPTARARSSPISPNNPSGAVFSEASLRAVNALCRERGLYHIADESYEYFTYGAARHVSPGSFAGAAAHTISMYSLSKAYGFAGWRIGYMVYPGAARRGDDRRARTRSSICPTIASQVARDRGARGRPRVLRAARPRARRDPRHRRLASCRRSAPLASVPAADGAFYCLLKVNTDAGSDGARRAADSRAQGRGHSRPGVRHDRRLLLPRRLRRAAEGDGRGRDRPPGRRAARDPV